MSPAASSPLSGLLRLLAGLCCLFPLVWLGEQLQQQLMVPVPGAVLGMILLLVLLLVIPTRISRPLLSWLEPTSQLLIRHLSLLFLPAGVGLLMLGREMGHQALIALVATTLGTPAALALLGWLFNRLLGNRNNSGEPS